MTTILPLISVIVPNYNHERFLKERLESIFNQSYSNFEVILLDDCSTDNSREILLEYAKHPKVSHCIFNEVNSGSPFKQWQKGIQLAKGEYIWIAESDDFSELTFLEELIVFFKNKDTVLVFCATIHFDEINNKKYRDSWAEALDSNRWNNDYCNNGLKEIENYFRYRNIIPNASAVVFKRDTILKIELPVDMRYCGDWYIWINMLKYGNISYISKPLNYYRKHIATTRVFKMLKDEKIRFEEYFKIINSCSSLWDRMRFLRQYEWVVIECYLKRRTLGKFPNIKLKLPFEFQLAYFLINIKKIFS